METEPIDGTALCKRPSAAEPLKPRPGNRPGFFFSRETTMAALTDSAIIENILDREGDAFTDRAADRGGPTKRGITLATLSRYLGRPATVAELKQLTRDQARTLYQTLYIDEPGYRDIQDGLLRGVVVDCCVQFGDDDATPWLQRAANELGATLTVDGSCGPKTLAAVNRLSATDLAIAIMALRIEKRGDVIASDARHRERTEDQALNAHGWANRDGRILLDIIGG